MITKERIERTVNHKTVKTLKRIIKSEKNCLISIFVLSKNGEEINTLIPDIKNQKRVMELIIEIISNK
jgi:hypothetical protein